MRVNLFIILFSILNGTISYSQTVLEGKVKLPTIQVPHANGLSLLSSKPEILYLSELKQIHSLKESYDKHYILTSTLNVVVMS